VTNAKQPTHITLLIALLTATFVVVGFRYNSSVQLLDGMYLAASLVFAIKLYCLAPTRGRVRDVMRLALTDIVIVTAFFGLSIAFFLMANGNSAQGVALLQRPDVKNNLFSIVLSGYFFLTSAYLLWRAPFFGEMTGESCDTQPGVEPQSAKW